MSKKNSYERRVYESVDDSSISLAISKKNDKKELMQQRVKERLVRYSLRTYVHFSSSHKIM